MAGILLTATWSNLEKLKRQRLGNHSLICCPRSWVFLINPPSHAHAAPMKLATSKPTETPKITTSVDQRHNHADSATSPDATTTLLLIHCPPLLPFP